jgi:hypothetical protein
VKRLIPSLSHSSQSTQEIAFVPIPVKPNPMIHERQLPARGRTKSGNSFTSATAYMIDCHNSRKTRCRQNYASFQITIVSTSPSIGKTFELERLSVRGSERGVPCGAWLRRECVPAVEGTSCDRDDRAPVVAWMLILVTLRAWFSGTVPFGAIVTTSQPGTSKRPGLYSREHVPWVESAMFSAKDAPEDIEAIELVLTLGLDLAPLLTSPPVAKLL